VKHDEDFVAGLHFLVQSDRDVLLLAFLHLLMTDGLGTTGLPCSLLAWITTKPGPLAVTLSTVGPRSPSDLTLTYCESRPFGQFHRSISLNSALFASIDR